MPTKDTILETLKEHFRKNKDSIIDDYFTFLRFKSISSEKDYSGDIRECVQWLQSFLNEMGFATELWETSGHPTLFAEKNDCGVDSPSVLIYNHYDVQPVDPLDLWDSPPFEPTVKGDTVYARGAQDNKGQCMYVIQALKAVIDTEGKLPVNVKLCIEGEEETGSKGLSGILEAKKDKLSADYLIVADLGIPVVDTPSVTLGCRGIVTMDVEATGSNTDLHSGTHGGRPYNPIHALAEVIASLRDESGRVRVSGFYDEVVPLSDEEKDQITFHFDAKSYEEEFGIKATGGEQEYSPLERSTIRPTVEVNGIWGGYTGDGFKTVIPAKAYAKISCRLVPDQDPTVIGKHVSDFLQGQCPDGIELKVVVHEGGGTAVRANADSTIVKGMAQAYSDVFEKQCGYAFEGGSIPIITELARACGGEVMLMGMGLDGDQIHAPNEHFGLDRFEKGYLIIGYTLHILGN